jgi:hypothetical protein
MSKKVLAVCGDSFMAATYSKKPGDNEEGSEGRHFSELLAKKLDYDLITLARGAVSNLCIRLQVEEMIRKKPDFILVYTTTSSRIDFPINADTKVDRALGIYNYRYNKHPDISALDPGFGLNALRSESLPSVLTYRDKHIEVEEHEKEVLTALEHYLLHIYDDYVADIISSCIISDMISALKTSGIPYMVLIPHNQLDLLESTRAIHKFNLLRVPHRARCTEILPNKYAEPSNRRWHTTDESQVLIAESMYNYLTVHNLLEPDNV